jgi:hypothetical protein
LLDIDVCLANHETKTFKNDLWSTHADFGFNVDSSIVMINSLKTSARGFKRECIVNFKDSALFVKRFEVLTDDPEVGYELLETIDYVTKDNNVKNVVRRVFPKPLSDTVFFQRLPFQNYSSELGSHYDLELEYVRRIMNRN